ncbi:MAG: nucleoside-diphosphate kinase [Candidatus Diapherotrites archaeon]|uniref:Nucleoside-diphosphate kinase n=1 Tax=Candidatus Iainarchaeum sp. TaxID=3101447 RepID=A0A7K4BZA8_9ARCH|nr:nucleoside-diphosphate kinase [Candidatus Diapherotrites archaeon]
MKSLIIITPKAFREKKFLEIMKKINENNYKIIGMKLERMDMFFLQKKVGKESDKNNAKKMSDLLKTPTMLIIIEGKEAIKFGKNLEKEYGKENIHISTSESVAGYEIERFFEKKEIFDY